MALLIVLAQFSYLVRSQCPPAVSFASWIQCNSNAAGVACNETLTLPGTANGVITTPSASINISFYGPLTSLAFINTSSQFSNLSSLFLQQTTVCPNPLSTAATTTAYCLNATEGSTTPLVCPLGVISEIEFASYGTPSGNCESGFIVNSACSAADTLPIVADTCLGRTSCILLADNSVFGDPCVGEEKVLAVSILCKSQPPPVLTVPAAGSFSIHLSQAVVGAKVCILA